MIYFDNAATTYPKPDCVYDAVNKANRELAFNAGRGAYAASKRVSEMIYDTRQKLSGILGLKPSSVYFESSSTEALNIIINGIDWEQGDNAYVTPFEHNAIIRPLYRMTKEKGVNIKLIPFIHGTWEVDTDRLQDMFTLDKPKAIFCTHISNVTGFVLPTGIIFEQAKKYNSYNVLDCTQSLGIVKPDIENVDFVVFAGHKSFYATFGTAGFIQITNKPLNVTKCGGTGSDSLNPEMPKTGHARFETGSINSVSIAGLNAGIDWVLSHDIYAYEKELTDYLIDKLEHIDKVHVCMPDKKDRIFGLVSITVDGYSSGDVGSILDEEYEICVRTGYHCSPYIHEFIGSLESQGTVRISLSAFTKKEEIDALSEALKSL